MYQFKSLKKGNANINILASGSLVNEAVKAQEELADLGIGSTIWCVTNYKRLREESLEADRAHLLYPNKKKKLSFLQSLLQKTDGPFVAVSDNMKMVSDQIGQWIPGGLLSLGTDGFGRSDTRENLRDFFEVDKKMIILASITQLMRQGFIDKKLFDKVYGLLDIKANRRNPFRT
jgi:pyruvate dehydrogenase E1 component